MKAPHFDSLPECGVPDRRIVAGVFMDREQYETEQWHEAREYGRSDGSKGVYWKATLEGLRDYSRLIAERRQGRINAARTLRERDEEFRDYVDSLDDAKPSY